MGHREDWERLTNEERYQASIVWDSKELENRHIACMSEFIPEHLREDTKPVWEALWGEETSPHPDDVNSLLKLVWRIAHNNK